MKELTRILKHELKNISCFHIKPREQISNTKVLYFSGKLNKSINHPANISRKRVSHMIGEV
jgi:hypothetical protein